MKKWSNTFKKNNTVYRNAAVSVYLANTITPARVYDANNRLYYTAPQGHTDINGYIEFYFDSSEYPTGQLFDITCTPNGVCDTNKTIRYTSLLIFTSNWSGVADDDTHKPEDDADVTSNQFAQSPGSIDSATVNFNGRNDRDDSAITAPAIATDGTAIDHTLNTDGSADISFEWSWGGTESDIDGFVVYVRGSTSSSSYDFGTTPSEEITFYCRPDRRHFILKGVAANLYWTFGVSAYRVVDPDINTDGFIATAVIQPSASGEDPYQPSANVAFAGNITGTVNDQSVSSVVYHDGSVIKRTDGTGVDADSLPESTARKWAGESGATVGADWGSNITSQPKMFRVVSVGNSSTTNPVAAGLYDEFNNVISGHNTSYIVDVYNRSTGGWDSHTTYDVYDNADNAATMASDLNNLDASKIVIIRTYDKPRHNRLTNGLPAAIYRCGGSRTIFASSNFKIESAYILVGIPDIGEGNGIELYAGDVDNDANAWVETTIVITSSGNIQLGDIKAKDAVDIGYSDGTTVEDLKPAQVGADVTNNNTAHNTDYLDGSDNYSGAANCDFHEDINLYDGKYLNLYDSEGTYRGGVYCDSSGALLYSSDNARLEAAKEARILGSKVYIGQLCSPTKNNSYDLGDSTYWWRGIRLSDGGYVYIGDSSHTFKLHYSDGSWHTVNAYINQSS